MEPAREQPDLPHPLDLPHRLEVAGRVVWPRLNRVDGPEGPLQLEPKVVEVLVRLAGRWGEVVSKEELVRDVWQGRYVSDDVIWRSIAELRRALGDDARRPRCIETVAKRGYRLLVPPPREIDQIDQIDEIEGSEEAEEPPPRAADPPSVPPSGFEGRAPASSRRPGRRALALAVALTTLAALAGYLLYGARHRAPEPAAGRRLRLAVLPFENLSGDPSQEWFSDGLTEELTSRLGSLKPAALGVVGRTSAMTFKGKREDLGAIARELGVDYLLEGSVRREGERVRVTARLIQASDQTAVWSARRDLNLGGTLHLQSRIGEEVARELALELLPAERAALERGAAANPAAHDAYLAGRHRLAQGTPEAVAASLPALARAAALDPRSATVQAALADAYERLALTGGLPPRQAFSRAAAAARRALALDPSLAGAHATLGSILFRHYRRYPEAETEVRRAIALDPDAALPHQDLARLLAARGQYEEALGEVRTALALDPLSLR